MEQESHQWIVHDHEEEEEEEIEIEDDGTLKRRQHVSHGKENLIADVVASFSSSSSLTSNGSEHSNGVCSVVTEPDGSLAQKEGEDAEIGSVGEHRNHVNAADKVDCETVGLGLVAEFAGEVTNGEVITGSTFGAAVSQNKNSVYFDKQQGMWKCRHCTWTKRFNSPWTVPIWNLKGYPDLLMNIKTMIQHGPCFFCETKDVEVNGLNGVQNGDASGSVHPTNPGEREFDVQVDQSVIQNSLCSEIVDEFTKTVEDKLPSRSELSQLHNSSHVQATAATNFHEETSTKEGPNLIKEIDEELEEFDVEAVLAKQETHDLFCPNCNSCITKRVILKKRKRQIHRLDTKAKHDKLETSVSSEPVDSPTQPEAGQGDRANVTSNIVSLEPPADDYHPDREPEVFRCLSCFSFFIPSGKCFNLFGSFGGASKNESAENSSITANNFQNPSNLPGSNGNWLKSLFTSNKWKKASDASIENSRTGSVEQHHSTSTTSNVLTCSEISHPEGPLADASIIKNVKPTLDINGHGGTNSPISSTNDLSSIQSQTKSAGDVMNGVSKVGQDFIDFSAKEKLLAGNPSTNKGEKKNASVDITKTNNVEVRSSMSFPDEKVSKYESVQSATAATTEKHVNVGETAKDAILNTNAGEPEFLGSSTVVSPVLEKLLKDVDKTPENVNNSSSSLGQGEQSSIQSLGSEILPNDVASNKQNSKIDAIFPSKSDVTLINKVQKDIEKEINPSTRKENEGGDVIVVVETETFESSTSQTLDNVPVEGVIVTEAHTQVQIGEQSRDEVGEPQGWEILKSIVYGGLIESITNLGIVSSAVSSGATPLNIIALGLANIIGGLFILGDNLIDLKNDDSGGDQMQMNAQDRYQESLGRRENFLLHVVVAVFSFLIFGSVPLIIYGVLINKNYYAEVKLAMVAATSVVCIVLLAIGKVYTRRPPKSYIKTVFYYVTLALAASGVSYIGGNLIKDLLEKLNHSESGFAITMPISDTSMELAWMSQ